MFDIVMPRTLLYGGDSWKSKEIYPDVITEDTSYEYKAVLNRIIPLRAKTLIGYANDKGGTLFIGVSNDGEAFGIDLEEVDKTKLLISRINDRHIFPHIKISYMMRSVDSNAEHFVLAVKVAPADSVIRYREGDYNETVFIKGEEMRLLQHRKKLFHFQRENMV